MCLRLLLLVTSSTIYVSGNTVLNASDVRLVNGAGPYGGRVEFQSNGVWGTICDSSFDISEASVLCRMMNVSLKATSVLEGARYGQGIGPIFLERLSCNGNEAHIKDCSFVTNTLCTHSRDVSIICTECGELAVKNGEISDVSVDGKRVTISCNNGLQSNVTSAQCETSKIWSVMSATCNDPGYPLAISGIRLENGIGLYDGRIEVLVNDTWGTICGTRFSYTEAMTVCHILGYSSIITYYSTSTLHGQGPGLVYLDHLDCTGYEDDLNKCTYIVNNSCSHARYAAVACNNVPLNVTNIRFINGTGSYDGRVELLVDGVWGTICGYFFKRYAARTLCKMNGGLNLVTYNTSAFYGEGTGPIVVSQLSCGSTAEHIKKCTYSSPYRQACTHSRDLAIACYPCDIDEVLYARSVSIINDTDAIATCHNGIEPQKIYLRCLNGTWQHANEETCPPIYDYPLPVREIRQTDKRVEINVNGTWGTICSTNFDSSGGKVLCRMLGLKYDNLRSSCAGSGPIYLDDLRCNGTEDHINKCIYNVTNTCSHSNDVCLKCSDPPLNITALSLSRGPYHGRIDLEVNNVWGTVCQYYGFNVHEAEVICRMFGFMDGAIPVLIAYYGTGSGPTHVYGLSCNGNENHINECKYRQHVYCSNKRDISVICKVDLNITDARLVNGTGSYDGRAEVKVNGTWGTICSTEFNYTKADAFCNILGLRLFLFFGFYF